MKRIGGLQLARASFLLLFSAAVGRAESPDFAYETTIDGYNLASGRDVAVDADGNAYAVASHYIDGMHLDILVIKLGPDGETLWTVTIQGNDHDYAGGIAVGDPGGVYLTGWTDSNDFPTTPDALYPEQVHFRDAFLTELSAADGSILYSTYLGGDYTDEGHGIALNADGEIYLVGTTGSTDFPTVNPIQAEINSWPYAFTDAFITKLSTDGRTILYSTYFGGSRDERKMAIALDQDDSIIITGSTDSQDFPMEKAIQSALAGGEDIFVARISSDGSALEFSSYLGGEDWDRPSGVELDANGYVYLAGSTRSISFPTTPGAFQETFVGQILGCEVPFGSDYNCDDMFVTKLMPDGSALVYSTYVGGGTIDECRDLALDSEGCAHIVGYTSSSDFPPNGIDTAAEIVVTKLNAGGSDIVYTVAVNSSSPGAGHGIATDDAGDVYFTGAVHAPADLYVAKLTRDGSAVAVSDGTVFSGMIRLGPSVPNPFSSTTRLSYEVVGERASPVRLAVYDASGRRVRTLVNASRSAGAHSVSWDGTGQTGAPVPAGVYFYELRWNGEKESGRVLLVR